MAIEHPYQDDAERGVTPYAPAQLAPVASPQQTFTNEQLALIKAQIAPDASDDELRLFIEVCRQTGLNPFMRQIYAISRNVKTGKAPNERWTKKMTIQTGIDGYRLLAARSGQLAGIDDAVFDIDDPDVAPGRASVTVWRWLGGHRCAFTATARWSEYSQTDKDGNATGLWTRMPYLMLAKCAEALALRKAFPAELSGIYTADEMAQADSADLPTYVEQAPETVEESAPTAKQIAALARGARALGIDPATLTITTEREAARKLAEFSKLYAAQQATQQPSANTPEAKVRQRVADLQALPVGERGN